MAPVEAPNKIVLYWYKASPYGRRIASYLALRNIEYAECMQPPIMPRKDLASLGVNYRRIPVMAIGRDVYLDTRLIIAKLEELFPPSAKHPALSSKETAPLAALMQKFIVDSGPFAYAARMIPPNLAMVRDRRFVEDRAEFFGRQKDPKLLRAESLVHMRQCFDLIESFLADGREWIAGQGAVGLVDVEAAWLFDWVVFSLQPPAEYFAETLYPKTYAWLGRYKAAAKRAASSGMKPTTIDGAQALQCVVGADYTDHAVRVDQDPSGLRQGAFVQLFPLDGGGLKHQDQGRLVKLTKDEVAISVEATTGHEIRIHAPRWQFRVREVEGGAKL